MEMLRLVLCCLLLFIFLPVPSAYSDDVFPDAWYVDTYPEHIEKALSYVGTQRGTPEGDERINQFLATVGLNPGNPYCAAFVSAVADISGLTKPSVRSGLARDFLTKDSIMAARVRRRGQEIPSGYIVGWARGNTIFGHLGFVLEWEGATGKTVEGNTSKPGKQDTASEFSGGGVWVKDRSILPGRHFRIVWFTPYEK